MNKNLETALKKIARSHAHITVLTGAGISAESGIPTFRGPEGYWTIGSKEYHPQDMATLAMFRQQPDEVWKWYLYRMNVCAQAKPNPGHLALVEMERMFKDRFILITQNVDGLHLRAGSSPERTYQIHGNISYMRCARECNSTLYSMPRDFLGRPKDQAITGAEQQLLVCPECGGTTRPHVLWFDEAYDEPFYRFNSSLKAAAQTDLLIVAGTSGATNLPNQVAWTAARRGAMMVDINIEENPFSQLAMQYKGFFIQEPSGSALPAILEVFKSA
jgi:NAD-dependent deacetylase